MLKEAIAARKAKSSPARSPPPSSPSALSSDDAIAKSVREVMDKEEMLSEMLLVASGDWFGFLLSILSSSSGPEQNELLFLSAVQALKRSFTLTGAKQIMSVYCSSSSPRFLDQALSFKRINMLEKAFADPTKYAIHPLFLLFCFSPRFFFDRLDSTLFDGKLLLYIFLFF